MRRFKVSNAMIPCMPTKVIFLPDKPVLNQLLQRIPRNLVDRLTKKHKAPISDASIHARVLLPARCGRATRFAPLPSAPHEGPVKPQYLLADPLV